MQDAQQQLLNAQSEAARVAKAKAMMEVETLRISQRIEILNNISTQATLLAGSSIAFLGGEALETVDDYESVHHIIGKFVYVGSGACALVFSLWVIVVASHLIALTRDASLRKNILKASRLLDVALREVRGVHMIAMFCLLLACLSGAILNMAMFLSLMATVIFFVVTVQVIFKLQFLSLQFYEEVELEFNVAATGSLNENWQQFLEPMRPDNVRRIMEQLRKQEEDDAAVKAGGHEVTRLAGNSYERLRDRVSDSLHARPNRESPMGVRPSSQPRRHTLGHSDH